MKKVLSILLAVMLCVSCLGVGVTANAATKNVVTITLKGTVCGDIVSEAVEDVNFSRAQNSLNPITIDASLTQKAEQRAAELMLFADTTNDSLPDGSPITSVLPGYGYTEDTIFGRIYTLDASGVSYKIDALRNSGASIQSVGIGVFEYKGTAVAYVIISTQPATEAATCTRRTQSFKVDVAISNFKYKNINYTAKNGGRYYTFSTVFFAGGAYSDYFTIPAAQVKYQSSNTKVLKIKDKKGYFKKNGKYTLSAKLNNGAVICKDSDTCNVYNNISVSLKKVTTPKKKNIKAKWEANVTDADGYQIQYATSKDFKKGVKTVTVKGRKKTSKTIGKLKSKKKYYVRVRAYIDQGNGEKAYTKWSKAKSIKVK